MYLLEQLLQRKVELELLFKYKKMEDKKTKQELLEYAQKLADKFADLKITVLAMLDEIDKIEIEYNKTKELIKKS